MKQLTEIEQTHLLAVISIIKMRYLDNMTDEDILKFMRKQYVHICLDDPMGRKLNLKNDPILKNVAKNIPKLIGLSKRLEEYFSKELINRGL